MAHSAHTMPITVSLSKLCVTTLFLGSFKPDNTVIEGFMQFAFDNADFNMNTLDGHDTFHTMGGIRCVIPAMTLKEHTSAKVQENTPASITGSFGNVSIRTYKKPETCELQLITV